MEKEKSKIDSKLETIKVIVNELEKLKIEDRREVVDFALKQVDLGESKTLTTQYPIRNEGLPLPGSEGIGNMEIDKFVTVKKPIDHYQRIAVLAYYLKHKEQKSEFKNPEMTKANTIARQPRIGNIVDAIAKAQNRYKFLTKGLGSATHQLSTLGEEVVNALPDQEKVKVIIKAGKSRVPKKRKKKSKK